MEKRRDGTMRHRRMFERTSDWLMLVRELGAGEQVGEGGGLAVREET